uniref:Butyrobetaine (gamma), 2-oxoglutarate dioxygenase (gamma-butyrobetaine hydroxylase) 1 n=1 Tax=Gasterosteus aculeatus aculeatus TaxID=481459 RepID=A0AAQ4QJL1_GASAC
MSTFWRLARPALQRSTSAAACRALRACRRPGHEERMVEVEWEGGGHSLYPFTWLRDNCQCPLCTLDSAQARKLSMLDLDVHTGLDVTFLRKRVSVLWPDRHTSAFDADWLKRRCFSAARPLSLSLSLLPERHYWDSELRVPTADFQEVLRDDRAALDWLLALRRVGVVHLTGAATERGAVARLAERVGYLRLTFYGHTWQVQDKPMANNVAYTSGKLGLHTDYPAMHFAPGVQFLHCISAAEEGGESEMVDGFHMAELLRREDPEAFRTLCSVHVDFTDTGTDYCDFMLQSKKKSIAEGRVVRINYNNATRDSGAGPPRAAGATLLPVHPGYVDVMNRRENVGDMLTFDNWRLLHGRRDYRSRADRARHLEGAYLDWDEVMSRLRILRSSVRGNA